MTYYPHNVSPSRPPNQYMQMRRRDYDYYDRGGGHGRGNNYYDDYDDYYDVRGHEPYYDQRREGQGQRRDQDYYEDEEPPRKKQRSAAGGIIGGILRFLFLIFVVVVLLLPQVLPDQEPFDQLKPYSDKFFDYIMAGMYKYQETPDTVEFKVERTFTIDTDGELDYKLLMPIPPNLEIDGYIVQEKQDVQFIPEYSYTIGENEIPNERPPTKWVWENSIPNGDTKTIKIIYSFKTAKVQWDISIKKSGTIDDIPQKFRDKYLGNQWPIKDFEDADNVDMDNDGVPDTEDVDDDNQGGIDKYRIETDDPVIRNLLLDILNKENLYAGTSLGNIGHLNVYEVVKAIYDRIDDTCIYPSPEQQYQDGQRYGSYPKWATGTWNDKRGDCDDQSILFISLCRAAGIPAMLEIGALYDPNFDNWEGHGWANVVIPYSDEYAQEKGETIITPMIDIVNNIFLFRDPNRFSEWVDDGVRGQLNQDGEWEYSHLEKRYLAWEYTRGDSSVDVDFGEEYNTLNYKAFPPEKELYL